MIVILWLLLILILLILAIGLALSFYFTQRAQLGEVHSPPTNTGWNLKPSSSKPVTADPARGVDPSSDGSDKAIVIMHGHGGSYDFDLYRAPALHEAGFNVLLFDFRAHGRSEGKRMTFGYEERRDVQAAIEFLHQRGMQHIGLLGFSYGGMAAMVSTPECADVEAVISDGGPARIRTAIAARGVELGFPHGWEKRLPG